MMRSMAAALAVALLLPGGVAGQDDEPERCPRGELTNADRLELTRPWVEGLSSFYATGDASALEALSTPNGLERLDAFDWRFRAVRDGRVQFEESAEIVEFDDWHEWCVDRRKRVQLDIAPVYDIAPGARTPSTSSGRVVEAVEGGQRRTLSLTFVREPETQAWLVDDVSEGLHWPRYVQPRPAKPCPGLKNTARAADPWNLEPWCTANGDGRKVFEWRGKPGGELAIGKVTCWAGAHSIMLGLPPGTPIGFGNVREYVRDPTRNVSRRRSLPARLPPAQGRDLDRHHQRPRHDLDEREARRRMAHRAGRRPFRTLASHGRLPSELVPHAAMAGSE